MQFVPARTFTVKESRGIFLLAYVTKMFFLLICYCYFPCLNLPRFLLFEALFTSIISREMFFLTPKNNYVLTVFFHILTLCFFWDCVYNALYVTCQQRLMRLISECLESRRFHKILSRTFTLISKFKVRWGTYTCKVLLCKTPLCHTISPCS